MSLLSIIIPTLNEEEYIGKCISFIEKNAAVRKQVEIIVIDAGSNDQTRERVPAGVRFYPHPEFIGHKYKSLNRGASYARGEYLLFLDADTLVPRNFDLHICELFAKKNIVGGAFEFQFEQRLPLLKIIEFCNRIRYRVRRSYYGDQGVFVRKSAFDKVGGYPSLRFMESAYLCQKLKKTGQLKLIRSKITTSGRRFIRGGILSVFVFDIKIWALNFFGFDIQKYADQYWPQNTLT